MAAPVNPEFWTTVNSFGSAGGPRIHALTDAGQDRAFRVGAQLCAGQFAAALQALYAAGGEGDLTVSVGSKVRLTPLGEFHAEVWVYLKERGYVERVCRVLDVRVDRVRLTEAGRNAVERGYGECKSLLQRVRKAHPIDHDD